MRDLSTKNKFWLMAAISGVVLLPIGIAQAKAVQRIEYQYTTHTFSDSVSGGGQLQADLTMDPGFSRLNITIATSGSYNSRLSTRCSDNHLDETSKFGVTGTAAGDILYTCDSNSSPIRIEGAIDDL